MTTKKKKTGANGAAKAANGADKAAKEEIKAATEAQASELDPEVAKKIAELRSTLRENFGKAVMALMMVPRYRSQSISDLQHLILEPMLADRLAIAYPGQTDTVLAPDMAGFAIWASVSEEVDAKLREQVANSVFPPKLKAEDWNSGNINWLLDVVASDRKTVTSVIANFRQVVKDGELRLHPMISRLVEPDVLEKMGARKSAAQEEASAS